MHSDPLAFFITWTCYGTWLPGDERGWMKWRQGDQVPQPLLADWCRERMVESALILNDSQRQLVVSTIEQHCGKRNWSLHAANCRTNHCHVVVTAREIGGEQVRDQLKAWCTRRLKTQLQTQKSSRVGKAPARVRWWTRNGSVRYLYDEESLEAAIMYTDAAQEHGGSHARSHKRRGARPPD